MDNDNMLRWTGDVPAGVQGLVCRYDEGSNPSLGFRVSLVLVETLGLTIPFFIS